MPIRKTTKPKIFRFKHYLAHSNWLREWLAEVVWLKPVFCVSAIVVVVVTNLAKYYQSKSNMRDRIHNAVAPICWRFQFEHRIPSRVHFINEKTIFFIQFDSRLRVCNELIRILKWFNFWTHRPPTSYWRNAQRVADSIAALSQSSAYTYSYWRKTDRRTQTWMKIEHWNNDTLFIRRSATSWYVMFIHTLCFRLIQNKAKQMKCRIESYAGYPLLQEPKWLNGLREH